MYPFVLDDNLTYYMQSYRNTAYLAKPLSGEAAVLHVHSTSLDVQRFLVISLTHLFCHSP